MFYKKIMKLQHATKVIQIVILTNINLQFLNSHYHILLQYYHINQMKEEEMVVSLQQQGSILRMENQ